MVWDIRKSSSGSNYHFLSSTPHISYLHSISPILQIWKLRPRKANELAQDWTVSNLQCRDSEPGVPRYKTQALSSASCFNLAFVSLLNLTSASLYIHVSLCSLLAELRIIISSYHFPTGRAKIQSQVAWHQAQLSAPQLPSNGRLLPKLLEQVLLQHLQFGGSSTYLASEARNCFIWEHSAFRKLQGLGCIEGWLAVVPTWANEYRVVAQPQGPGLGVCEVINRINFSFSREMKNG